MGSTEAKMVEAIRDPSEEPRVREVFDSFDADGSGALDEKEWRNFCLVLWKADIDGATEDVKREVFIYIMINFIFIGFLARGREKERRQEEPPYPLRS